MGKVRKCLPSRYAVAYGERITYGWRCARCGIHTRRYATEERREQTLVDHLGEKRWKRLA